MNIINILTYIAMIGAAASFFTIVYKLFASVYEKRDDILLEMNRRMSLSEDMDYKTLKLSKLGVMYRMKNYNFTPANYFVLRVFVGIVTAILFFFIGSSITYRPFIAIPVGFIAGYFLTNFYFEHENKSDNEEMIMDIYNTYANLKIQMAAGIYIREIFEYTYKMVKNERYKEALAELILNFSDKTISSTDAVNLFKNRFASIEIDKLSSLISSFLQYGMNSSHADDIMVEIQGLIQAETIKAEHDIETRASITNFAFFAIIIVMVIFVVFSSFNMGGIF